MDKVIAKGLIGKEEVLLEATIEDGELVLDFDGGEDELLESTLLMQLKYAPAMGGTFYPEEKSLLNVVNVLQNDGFFTKLISIDIEGEPETVPLEDEPEGEEKIVY